MIRQQIAFGFNLLFVWVVIIHFGANLFETLIIYPNIFHDIPRSLQTSVTFLAITGPRDFFMPVGILSMIAGIGVLIFSWRMRTPRYWILGGMIVIFAGEFLFSVIFFWPRNTIMFGDGLTVYSPEYLKQTAFEFQTIHWLRLALSATATILAFIGFLKVYQNIMESARYLTRERLLPLKGPTPDSKLMNTEYYE
jgi:hypothetical protein